MKNNNKYATPVKMLALCKFAGVTPRVFTALMQKFKALDSLLDTNVFDLTKIDGMKESTAKSISKAKSYLDKADEYYKKLSDREIRVITSFDTDYPALLNELNDPPPILYSRGKIPDSNKKSVTILGTTDATNEGIELTITLTKRLVKADVMLISTLSKGIDASVHLGCKSAGGVSYALLDEGFDFIDSSEQMPIAIDIAQEGGVLTEYSPEHKRVKASLQESNRLLVGLTNAVIITQFYKDSERVLDILSFCNQIGKMAFLMVDPKYGALSDEEALAIGVKNGLISMVGFDQVDNIIKALV